MENQPVQTKTSFKERIEKIKLRIRKTPKSVLVLIALLIIIIIGLLIFAVSKYNPTNKQANETNTAPYAQTDLKVELQSDFGNSGEAGVTINTGDNAVSAVQLELIYEPSALKNVSIRPGSFFKNANVLLEKVDEKNGKITYAIGVKPGAKGIKGNGNVVVISFDKNKGSSAKTTFIKFLPETMVTADNNVPTVLRSGTGVLINLQPTTTPSVSPKK